jgi:hypothetical protein
MKGDGFTRREITILVASIVISGVAIFGYFAAQIFDSIAHSVLGGAWREKKRVKMIEQLRNHIILGGYGRVGRGAGDELREAGFPYELFEPQANRG